MTRLEAPRWFQTLNAALVALLLGAALGLLCGTARIVHHFQPSVAPEDRWVLQGLWLLTLVSVASLVPIAIYLCRLSWTVLEYGESGVRLRRPASQWHGPWHALRRAYVLNGFLGIQTREQRWGWWHVRLPASSTEATQQTFRRRLPPGIWLDETQARRYVLRRSVPLVLSATLLGLLAVYAVERATESWLPSPPSSGSPTGVGSR